MLEIKKITKIYETSGFTQKALDGVSVKFRDCEFASILGQSGSGKTTLLNVIGGLDQYTSGDLIINGVSTKKYNNRNWDSYRNHRVGFIFQSYNLITHQTILKNVELALTLSGVSKSVRVRKAKEALKTVGLERHMYKKPNQLSGGQMQRVAIARALINDPDIILADEPTGALDTQTSKQIMELLKSVSKDKLVIMVTHNPELANEYSTRIIKLQDGHIIDDSNPFDGKEKETKDSQTKTKKTSMSFLTALGLSLNNLLTKKGRTILTAFAGSIGIIGIALILSLSNGFQNYIDKLQEDTLSSYPLTISSESMDLTSLLVSMMEQSNEKGTPGKIVENQQFVSMFSNITTNDLKSFKAYLEKSESELSSITSSIDYRYSIDPIIYTKSKNEIIRANPNQMFTSMMGGSGAMSAFSSNSSIFTQISDDEKSLNDNYKLLKGVWPTKYNEMVLVLPNDHSIPDLLLYLLGIRDMEELYDIMTKVMSGESVNINNKPMEFTYEDFLNMEFKLINNVDLYKYNSKYKIYEDMKDDEKFVKNLYKNAETLKIVGIVCPSDDSNSMMTTTGIGYKASLINHIIDYSKKSKIVEKQLKNENRDVFSNKDFDDESKSSDLNFNDLISIDKKKLSSAFGMKISEDDISKLTGGYMEEISASITTDTKEAKKDLEDALKNIAKNSFSYYKKNPYHKDNDKAIIETNDISKFVGVYLETSEVSEILSTLEKKYVIPASVYKTALKSLLEGLYQGYITAFNMVNSTFTKDPKNPAASIEDVMIDSTINTFMSQTVIVTTIETLGAQMTEAKMQSAILTKVGNLTGELVKNVASSFNVDSKKIASAFKFNLTEDELSRIMSAMSKKSEKKTAKSNLILLGYQDLNEPTMINVYFKSFEGKEKFLTFIDDYNKKVGEEQEINYSDTTGILMSSVKKIVDSVSYVLIAFVSIALIVSSIMIGIITYISVLERTKEIGILRAIGASKKNISSIFNAETFIIGLLSGLLGIGTTLSLIPIINGVIHSLTKNNNINASIPIAASIILIILSILLTLIGGLIPSRIASKKDPVEALRTE